MFERKEKRVGSDVCPLSDWRLHALLNGVQCHPSHDKGYSVPIGSVDNKCPRVSLWNFSVNTSYPNTFSPYKLMVKLILLSFM